MACRAVRRIALGVGLVFVPAATAWLLSYQAGYALLGYPPFWVLLTAAHFHIAGVALLIIAHGVPNALLVALVALAAFARTPPRRAQRQGEVPWPEKVATR